MADKIILKGIEVKGRHGCSAEERVQLQRFVVDIELHLRLRQASKSDDLGDTIDYMAVLSDVKKIVGGTSRNLIETVAQEIADFLLRRYMLLEGVRVAIHKPSPPVGEKFGGASIEILRHRG
ncbi:MAG: dihydroneopterin aldolase [Selenomonadaceae bacterium]|nr:dihydroneopterin aldolase [Selenomonadaceae bacterium]